MTKEAGQGTANLLSDWNILNVFAGLERKSDLNKVGSISTINKILQFVHFF